MLELNRHIDKKNMSVFYFVPFFEMSYLGIIRYMPLRWQRINTSAKLLQNTLSDHTERVQLLQGMVSNLVTESVKSKDRLDIAMEHVSVLLSRIRDHPVPSSRYARNDCFT